MTGNFLPAFHPVVTHGAGATVQCLVRDKAVRATPEERVRQRVLHWLVHDKGWAKDNLRLEQSYRWMSDPARTRIRSDIELLDGNEVLVVVECKRGDVPLDERVDQQAIEYALKARARWIWTTNGERHGFFAKRGCTVAPGRLVGAAGSLLRASRGPDRVPSERRRPRRRRPLLALARRPSVP